MTSLRDMAAKLTAPVLTALLVLSWLGMITSLYLLAVIPHSYVIIGASLSGMAVAWVAYLLCWHCLRSKKSRPKANRRRSLVMASAVILTVLFGGAWFASNQLSSLLDGLFGDGAGGQATVEYSVFAPISGASQLDELRGKTIASAVTDETDRTAAEYLQSKVDYIESPRPGPDVALSDVSGGTLPGGLLRSSQLELLREDKSSGADKVRVIYTFEVPDLQDSAAAQAIDKPFAVYLSGIDTYGAINTVSRSDVNIIAVVNPSDKSILLVNTPRDYYVQLHGTSGLPDKLTHAGLYGVDMSRKTLEDLYAINIDYSVRINFDSLVKLIDTIGDVSVYSPTGFSSDNYSFRAGMNTLNSQQALEFARTRYAFADGDRERGKNQQRVVEAIVSKLSQPESLGNLQAILPALSGSFQTTMPRSMLTELMREQIEDTTAWRTTSISVDGTGDMQPTYSMGALPLSVMIPDDTSVAGATSKIKSILNDT